MKKHLFLLVAAAVLANVSHASAWWSEEHEYITQNAVAILANSQQSGALGIFFSQNGSTLASYGGLEPPSSTLTHTPQLNYYAPNGAFIMPSTHYIDIDNYSEFATHTFPTDQTTLVSKYGLSFVRTQGTAPWNAADYERQLSDLMRNAKTAADWNNLLQMAGAEAHFLEDLHNPMHLAANYDGQKTGQTGLHARYEGQEFVGHLGTDLVLTSNTSELTHYTSMIDTIMDDIYTDYAYNDDILAADNAAVAAVGSRTYNSTYYDTFYSLTKSFDQTLMQDASQVVANTWYTAWIDAGSPTPAGVAAPEPASLMIFAAGGLALVLRRRR